MCSSSSSSSRRSAPIALGELASLPPTVVNRKMFRLDCASTEEASRQGIEH